MALVSVGFFLNVDVVDSGGDKSTLSYTLTSIDLPTAAADAALIVADLNAVTAGLVRGYRIGQKWEDDTDIFGPTGVHVEDFALLTCRLDSTLFKTVDVRIPAPEDSIFADTQGPGYNLVDPNDVNVQAYLANFVAAGPCTISDGEKLADITVAGNVKGRRGHRKSNKG